MGSANGPGPGRGEGEDPVRPDRGAQRAQQGQELDVAVGDRLDVDVDAVEALVHQAAALGHDALPLAEVGEVERARRCAGSRRAGRRPRAGPSCPAPRRRAAARKRRICSRLWRGSRPARVEGDEVRVDVADAVARPAPNISASISSAGCSFSSQRCSSQTALRSWLKGWGAASPTGA